MQALHVARPVRQTTSRQATGARSVDRAIRHTGTRQLETAHTCLGSTSDGLGFRVRLLRSTLPVLRAETMPKSMSLSTLWVFDDVRWLDVAKHGSGAMHRTQRGCYGRSNGQGASRSTVGPSASRSSRDGPTTYCTASPMIDSCSSSGSCRNARRWDVRPDKEPARLRGCAPRRRWSNASPMTRTVARPAGNEKA